MGESCCGKTNQPALAAPAVEQEHDHDYDHDHGHGHVESSGGCCGDSLSETSSLGSTCCGSEERCDEKCISAVAALECKDACENSRHDGSSDHPHDHDSHGHDAGTACPSHMQAAFNRYSSYLQELRCICRAAINNGAVSLETCCAGNAESNKKVSHKHHGHEHGGHKHKGHKHEDHKKKSSGHILLKFEPSGKGKSASNSSKERDLEKSGAMETINFLVSGMDCTSCSDKLMRVFDSMAGVSQARVNFVMGNGELNVDTSVTNADEVIRFASTASGFSLSKLVGGNYFLDILASTSTGKQLADEPLRGVTNVESINKSTVRISYEPTVIGARDLYDLIKDRDGCRGLAEPSADPQLENSRRRLWDQLIKTVLAAVLTIPVAVVAWSENLVDGRVEGIVSLVLGTLVQMIAIPEFYRPALSALWYSKTVEMDMLVVMSITAAYVYSVIAFSFEMADQPLDEGQFFETSTMLITLILLGRLVAAFARVRAVAAVSLRSRQNTAAVLVTKEGDCDIDARLLQYGDRFKVLPHSRVPTDGVVVSGTTEVDESMLTGESLPVLKREGDAMIAGTVNGDGTVIVQLTRLPGKNTVTDIAQLVEEAANSKPQLQDLANKIAGWFVPVMAVVALLVFVIWIACGMEILDYSAGRAVGNAVTYAVATLAVACPCALGLAVPMVLVVAGGIGARGGVIIKSAETTERARKTTDIVFDKTGTITEGHLVVVEHVVLDQTQEDAFALTKSLVAGGKHPVSAAIEKFLKTEASSAAPGVNNVRVVPGAGIEADYEGSRLRAGNSRWTGCDNEPELMRLQQAGLTTLTIMKDSKPLIVFGLSAQIRPEAERVIADLQARGIAVHIVSGDQTMAVQAVAATVGVPPANAVGERTPPEKRDYVAALMEDKTKYVLFCGDGTNDAVAVAQANVGAQMGGGLTSSDVTQGAADVILIGGLEGIPFLLSLSRSSFNRMAFNFVWSGIYNVLAVTMASGAWVRFRIPPRYAGLGEMVSVVPVILAAVSLFLVNYKNRVVSK
ncbi:hypothetical protein S7711_10222 [Stachybotrys chartarum IBT 7711]|uniref:HMA domain-containing protein n=1 Tax=Stachybotrys chartarum (strain CBS 109288 / IBT 7711) TaxID=1280523 RepID=A0A084B2P4_STACB|nr:hypothetical protein S7711_10222 [Stachybotrys chartarum IBT 7711]KFA80852.1 hypothetical protein S40288_09260 [Stachybotrys chartarum IBT 40288]